MSSSLRFALITAIAPIAWGSTYLLTSSTLPANDPLWGGTLRALPAGIVLLLLARKLPKGSWWWRSLILGILNAGLFFALIYESSQRLPSSIASTVMAITPLAMMVMGWLIMKEKPSKAAWGGGVLGIAGVLAIVAAPVNSIDFVGVIYALLAMLMTSIGYVLATYWQSDQPIVATTAWQLVGGGLASMIFALVFEGGPPALDTSALLGFGYLSMVATAIAYVAWFTGLSKMSVGAASLIGLLNPITGVVLGVLFANEKLTFIQCIGILLVLVSIQLGQSKFSDRSSLRKTRT